MSPFIKQQNSDSRDTAPGKSSRNRESPVEEKTTKKKTLSPKMAATKRDIDDDEKDNLELLEFDVLVGRGKGIAKHPGNVFFRCVVWDYKTDYCNARIPFKQHIAQKVLDIVAERGGRVLEYAAPGDDGQHGTLPGNNIKYVLVSPERALEKTCQALRERKNVKPPQGYRQYRRSLREQEKGRTRPASTGGASSSLSSYCEMAKLVAAARMTQRKRKKRLQNAKNKKKLQESSDDGSSVQRNKEKKNLDDVDNTATIEDMGNDQAPEVTSIASSSVEKRAEADDPPLVRRAAAIAGVNRRRATDKMAAATVLTNVNFEDHFLTESEEEEYRVAPLFEDEAVEAKVEEENEFAGNHPVKTVNPNIPQVAPRSISDVGYRNKKRKRPPTLEKKASHDPSKNTKRKRCALVESKKPEDKIPASKGTSTFLLLKNHCGSNGCPTVTVARHTGKALLQPSHCETKHENLAAPTCQSKHDSMVLAILPRFRGKFLPPGPVQALSDKSAQLTMDGSSVHDAEKEKSNTTQDSVDTETRYTGKKPPASPSLLDDEEEAEENKSKQRAMSPVRPQAIRNDSKDLNQPNSSIHQLDESFAAMPPEFRAFASGLFSVASSQGWMAGRDLFDDNNQDKNDVSPPPAIAFMRSLSKVMNPHPGQQHVARLNDTARNEEEEEEDLPPPPPIMAPFRRSLSRAFEEDLLQQTGEMVLRSLSRTHVYKEREESKDRGEDESNKTASGTEEFLDLAAWQQPRLRAFVSSASFLDNTISNMGYPSSSLLLDDSLEQINNSGSSSAASSFLLPLLRCHSSQCYNEAAAGVPRSYNENAMVSPDAAKATTSRRSLLGDDQISSDAKMMTMMINPKAPLATAIKQQQSGISDNSGPHPPHTTLLNQSMSDISVEPPSLFATDSSSFSMLAPDNKHTASQPPELLYAISGASRIEPPELIKKHSLSYEDDSAYDMERSSEEASAAACMLDLVYGCTPASSSNASLMTAAPAFPSIRNVRSKHQHFNDNPKRWAMAGGLTSKSDEECDAHPSSPPKHSIPGGKCHAKVDCDTKTSAGEDTDKGDDR